MYTLKQRLYFGTVQECQEIVSNIAESISIPKRKTQIT